MSWGSFLLPHHINFVKLYLTTRVSTLFVSSLCMFFSQVSTVDLQVGDTIIMGSDGLFDNIFDQEIVSVVSTHDDVSNAGTCFLLNLISVMTQLDSFLWCS